MIIDVSISYDGRNIITSSEAARYSETRPAVIGLSKKRIGGTEVIECVGEPLTPLMERAFWQRDKGSRVYRFFDPFLVDSFDPDAASAIVRHCCFVVQSSIKPARSLFRWVFRLDRFSVSIRLPQYDRVPEDKRKIFEKELRGRFRFRIEE